MAPKGQGEKCRGENPARAGADYPEAGVKQAKTAEASPASEQSSRS